MEKHGEDRIVALYQSGLSMQRVAEEMGISENGVRGVLIRRGVERRRRNPLVIADRREKIVASYTAGMPSATVAKTYGVSQRFVSKLVRNSGHAAHRKSPTNPAKVTPDVEAVIMAARYKESGATVARRLGLHPSTVYKLWSARAKALGMGR